MSETMKAWVHDFTGGPDVLAFRDVAKPLPGARDVLVQNRAIGLNPVDWKFVEWGHPDWDWPHVPGVDGAGIVTAVGSDVTHISVGARVAYHNDLVRPGSFAEFTAIPARAALPLPDGLTFSAAAALPCPWLTAWQAIEKLPCSQGMVALMTGASGAVGGALLQLAVERGFVVHAIASEREHKRVLGLGAASVTEYRSVDWIAPLKERFAAQPLDVVFDMVSGDHAASLTPLLGANGHLVCIQDRQETAPLPAFTTTISCHEVGLNALHGHGHDRHWGAMMTAGAQIAQGFQTGRYDPQILEVSDFGDLPGALQRLKDGPNPGNRVVMLS
ncbi:zinc-binding dehydrogenase [Pacificoceanicola onchidii]|uniref:zinc-binding dehydrogenase n=1 Tax=Pacificoceanicola onchidii TaxID=2562685 RepID=UPI00197EB502|nr:zinc-binding dehydrogenase [Pacificoceanicola onchidii]